MRIIVALLAVGITASCGTTRNVVMDESKIHVVKPPAALLKCPQITAKDLPNPATLTNQQVSDFITKLIRYSQVCAINMQKIKEFIEQAEKIHGTGSIDIQL